MSVPPWSHITKFDALTSRRRPFHADGSSSMKGMCATLEKSSPHPASARAADPLNIRRRSLIGRRRGTAVDTPCIERGGRSRRSAEVLRMRAPDAFVEAALPNASLFKPTQHELLHALRLITTSLNALLCSTTICVSRYTVDNYAQLHVQQTCVTSATARSMPSGPLLLMSVVAPTHLEARQTVLNTQNKLTHYQTPRITASNTKHHIIKHQASHHQTPRICFNVPNAHPLHAS